MKSIGLATVDFQALLSDLEPLTEKENETSAIWKALYGRWGTSQRELLFIVADEAYRKEFRRRACVEESRLYIQNICEAVQLGTAELRCLHFDDGTEFNDEGLALVSLGGTASTLVLPIRYVEIKPYQNYDSLTGTERKAILTGRTSGTSENVLADARTTLQAKTNLSEQDKKLELLKQQMAQTKNADIPELADMKAKIAAMQAALDEKIQDLMAELEVRKAEMENQKRELEFEIYKLSSEIYSIRCYTGECVSFALIRDGQPAPANTPLVLNQKMRYMDEELGRIASIYNVDFSDVCILEKLIQVNDAAFEAFCPTKRCVTLVRVSRENKAFVSHETYANMLDWTKKFRGKAIGILIRDGEKLFVGWTDEEYIDFAEDLFFRPGETIEAPCERGQYEGERDFEKRMEKKHLKQLNEAVGRSFIFSVLQGLVDRDLICFPEGVSVRVNRPSDYIVRNFADGWITDERYGSFDDMMRRCNASVIKGDSILTMQYLRPETRDRSLGWRDDRWNNDRGIGERNRTHDVYAKNCTVYQINKVISTADYTLQYFQQDDTKEERTYYDETESEILKIMGYRYWKDVDIVAVSNEREHFYISLRKECSLSGTARANFEVFPQEFLNLTFFNSVWLEYILQTQKTGTVFIGGERINFAHLIPYLKTALDFVRKREQTEKNLLMQHIPHLAEDPEWPARLSEWKLMNDVHTLTEYSAKRFAKQYRGKESKGNA